jgi:NAD(P)-dependent dehydrogenase (short-subunit alcohol dehydrogenase family)
MPMTTVLITGANRGIGLELTRQWAEQGAQVLACCRKPDTASALQELARKHSNLSCHALDVGHLAQIEALAQSLADRPIDVLLNNAGVYGGKQALGEIDYDAWVETFRINTLAPIKMAECFAQHVASSQKKTIATISTQMASVAQNDAGNGYIYRSTKSALNMALKSLSVDLKKQHITVLMLHPGWVKTDMGGPQAPLLARDSAAGLIQVIEKATINDTGRFLTYEGQELPW